MRFPPSFLDELRARLLVSEVVGRRVRLKKQGREWIGLSPFNKEKSPSFTVNDQKGFFHDFSSGKHGDIFGFVMETEGLSFPEAVERLATFAGLPMPVESKEEEEREERRKSLHEIMELATKFFEDVLMDRAGAKARGYLLDRGIKSETQIEFRMGYAPPERFALKEYLGGRGVSVADMIEAGLLIAGDDIPVPYDRFRDRIIIPIHDQRGRVIAFGGRALSSDVAAKYLNSPETPLFHKGSTVFNFHRARQPAHEDGTIVVVEGYMDAIAIYQAGLKSVVASMGTALTEDQINLLWRLSPEPIVCFDADRAGIAAAYNSVDRILPILKLGHTYRFALMQGEKDPDDLIREKGLEAFKSILSGSLPLWDVLWERETTNRSAETPDAQASIEARFMAIVRTIKDRTIQTAYVRTSRMALANLFWQANRSRRDLPAKGKGLIKTEVHIEKDGHRHGLQKLLLGLLVHYPEFLEDKAERVAEIKFEHDLESFRRALYKLLIDNGSVSVQLVYDQLSRSFYEVLEEIHGRQNENRRWGHRLLVRFPILKLDPSPDFVSRCMDHFAAVLRVEQMEEDIDDMQSHSDLASDSVSERFLELIRDLHVQRERVTMADMALEEEAQEIRRVVLGPTRYERVAA